MTQEEIIEGNKLIAEFMGWKLITPEMRRNPDTWDNSYYEKEVEDWYEENGEKIVFMDTRTLCSVTKTKYHSSWDWLMPVVEKISMTNNGDGSKQRYFFNTNRCAKFKENVNDKPIKIRIGGVCFNYNAPNIKINGYDEKECTWLAVIEFIKWYNVHKL